MAVSCTASININIDGLPLFNNGTAQVWPILFNIHEKPDLPPMIAGIFHGHSKPKKVEQFLDAFVEEILPIIKNGLVINNQILSVTIRAVICDAPARAFVKGVVNFNSINGCLKCHTVGEYSKELRTIIFPQTNAICRTDSDFRNTPNDKHRQYYKIQQGKEIVKVPIQTPFLKLPLDMIQDFVVSDSLHLLHLGVTKKLLHFGTVTSNIHNLTHVVEDVEKKGSLPSISTYPFENHLYQIKNMVRSGR
ncbi:uncharacterized protein LOC128736685 [Sabethes cyaneus]|uniref:uncharacterized protein LOC128736685 n=1 Tax=Sabethes cyaneus TaxID=53552 RepID=UPI00237EC613|nr:uncharacterized protein LOC128736685 [Sabethes cyaneus]